MRFIDVLNKIDNNEIIVESDEVPSILGKRKEWMNTRKVNREKMTKEKEKYNDDKRYNDHKGKQWLDTSATDMMTIIVAALDGIADTSSEITHKDYMNLKTAGDIMKILDKYSWVKEVIFGQESMETKGGNKVACFNSKFMPTDEDMAADDLKERMTNKWGIWGFLNYYLHQKEITVYRGINVDKDLLNRLHSEDAISKLNPQRLIQTFSNESKEFNSFSVNPDISTNFATNYGGTSNRYVILKGIANKQDVNWAFTAYLMGRHGGVGEQELNINNIRTLKNLEIIKDKSNLKPVLPDLTITKNVMDKFIDQYNNQGSNKLDKQFKNHWKYTPFKNNCGFIRLFKFDITDSVYNICHSEDTKVKADLPVINNKIVGDTLYNEITTHYNTLIGRIHHTCNFINATTGEIIGEFKEDSYKHEPLVIVSPATENYNVIFSFTACKIIDFEHGVPSSVSMLTYDNNMTAYKVSYYTKDDDYMHAILKVFSNGKTKCLAGFNELDRFDAMTVWVKKDGNAYLYNINTGKVTSLPNDAASGLSYVGTFRTIHSYEDKLGNEKFCKYTGNGFEPVNSLNKLGLVAHSIKTCIMKCYKPVADHPFYMMHAYNTDGEVYLIMANKEETEFKPINTQLPKPYSLVVNVMAITNDVIVFELKSGVIVIYDKKSGKLLDDFYKAVKQMDNGSIAVIAEDDTLKYITRGPKTLKSTFKGKLSY